MRENKATTRIISSKPNNDDTSLDTSLRPKRLVDFIGQNKVKNNLKIAITAAMKRGESLDHVLIYGPPGLGKTTLAYIIAAEMRVNIKISSGPAIERPGDLAAHLAARVVSFRFLPMVLAPSYSRGGWSRC